MGELLHALISLPIPATIYGLVLMLMSLCLKIVQLDQIKESSNFLLSIMSILFIPSAVALVTVWSSLREILFPVLLIGILMTLVVIVVTGGVTQFIIHWEENRHE